MDAYSEVANYYICVAESTTNDALQEFKGYSEYKINVAKGFAPTGCL